LVTVCQSVKTGDPLFKLDDRQRQADLAARQADLRVAESLVKVNAAMLDDVTRQLNFAESPGQNAACVASRANQGRRDAGRPSSMTLSRRR
jgi:multidrug resistance efflux pump